MGRVKQVSWSENLRAAVGLKQGTGLQVWGVCFCVNHMQLTVLQNIISRDNNDLSIMASFGYHKITWEREDTNTFLLSYHSWPYAYCSYHKTISVMTYVKFYFTNNQDIECRQHKEGFGSRDLGIQALNLHLEIGQNMKKTSTSLQVLFHGLHSYDSH